MKDFNHHGYSVRGVVVELDGELIGVGGVLHSSPMQAFSVMDDKIRKYPRTIMKVILSFKELLNNYQLPIYAKCSMREKNSRKVLERIGFELVGGRLYQWKP